MLRVPRSFLPATTLFVLVVAFFIVQGLDNSGESDSGSGLKLFEQRARDMLDRPSPAVPDDSDSLREEAIPGRTVGAEEGIHIFGRVTWLGPRGGPLHATIRATLKEESRPQQVPIAATTQSDDSNRFSLRVDVRPGQEVVIAASRNRCVTVTKELLVGASPALEVDFVLHTTSYDQRGGILADEHGFPVPEGTLKILGYASEPHHPTDVSQSIVRWTHGVTGVWSGSDEFFTLQAAQHGQINPESSSFLFQLRPEDGAVHVSLFHAGRMIDSTSTSHGATTPPMLRVDSSYLESLTRLTLEVASTSADTPLPEVFLLVEPQQVLPGQWRLPKNWLELPQGMATITLVEMPPGSYKVTCQTTGFAALRREFTLAPGENATQSLTLDRAEEIGLLVTNQQRPYLPDPETVLFVDSEGQILPMEVKPAWIEGQRGFRLSGIPPGGGYLSVEGNLSPVRAPSNEPVRMDIREDSWLKIVLHGLRLTKGNHALPVDLWFLRDSRFQVYPVGTYLFSIGGNGAFFTQAKLPPAHYVVRAVTPMGRVLEGEVDVVAGQLQEIHLGD